MRSKKGGKLTCILSSASFQKRAHLVQERHFQEVIFKARAVCPVKFSGSKTCRPFSSRVNFSSPPPSRRTLLIFPGQFGEALPSDLMATFPSLGISSTMA